MMRWSTRLAVALAIPLLVAGCGQKVERSAPAPGKPPTVEAPFEPEEEAPPAMERPPAANGPDETAAEAAAPRPVPAPGPAPAEEATPPPARGMTAGGAQAGTLPYCDIVEERIPAEECAMLQSVARGTGAFKTPERMRKGEQASVTLVVSRTAGSDAPSRALAGVAGREGRFAPAVGRFIEASLIAGPGLAVTIDPATPALQDLYASDQALWRWTLTAEETGRHDLTIRTRVMTKRADGSFAPRGSPFTDSRTVEVYVAGAAAIEAGAREADRALRAVVEPTGTLTTLLKALGGLVAAAGALWLAVKTFGRGKADPPPGS